MKNYQYAAVVSHLERDRELMKEEIRQLKEIIEIISKERDRYKAALDRLLEPVGFIDADGDPVLSVDGLKGGYLYRLEQSK